MKFRVTQKILAGYLAGFILLLAFASLTLFNGKKIEATTIALSQEKIPGLIAVSELKYELQSQTNHLYELYATNDQALFEKRHKENMDAAQMQLNALEKLPEFKVYQGKIAALNEKQKLLTEQFVNIMKQADVNWDSARSVLAEFTKGSESIGDELHFLVQSVTKETLARAQQSQAQTETLMTFALVLSGVVFLGILGMAYYTHRQVAVPLREVSSMLSGISSRKDLTYRLQQHNDDEVGDIVVAVNNLLEEFQRLASTLDGTAQEVHRTVNNITQVTEETKTSMTDSNANLRNATHDFMKDIQKSSENKDATKEIDMNLHRAQMKFIQTHIVEIDEGTKITDRHVKGLQASISKLQKLADHLHVQIRTLNF